MIAVLKQADQFICRRWPRISATSKANFLNTGLLDVSRRKVNELDFLTDRAAIWQQWRSISMLVKNRSHSGTQAGIDLSQNIHKKGNKCNNYPLPRPKIILNMHIC
jgi:hypothetical protein